MFEVIKSEMPPKKPKRKAFPGLAEIPKRNAQVYDPKGFVVNPKPLKKRSTTTVAREKFLDVVCDGLTKYQYVGVRQRLDLMVACRYVFILPHFSNLNWQMILVCPYLCHVPTLTGSRAVLLPLAHFRLHN